MCYMKLQCRPGLFDIAQAPPTVLQHTGPHTAALYVLPQLPWGNPA